MKLIDCFKDNNDSAYIFKGFIYHYIFKYRIQMLQGKSYIIITCYRGKDNEYVAIKPKKFKKIINKLMEEKQADIFVMEGTVKLNSLNSKNFRFTLDSGMYLYIRNKS
ncbi:hypothetical protein AZ702_09005 [Campylobacter coli]|nr:hypothetical protein [Campylobacter coli]